MNRQLLFIFLFVVSIPALANTGIPMAVATMSSMIILFIPVVAIESLIVSKITNIPFSKSAKTMAVANLITTFIGMPLANVISWIYSLGGNVVLSLFPQSFAQSHSTFLRALVNFYWYDNFDHMKYMATHIKEPRPTLPLWYSALALGLAFLVNLGVSYYLEYRYMSRILDNPKPQLKRASLIANASSYVFLALFALWQATRFK
jgi:hypothetical protein